jgi:hypothetical protein
MMNEWQGKAMAEHLLTAEAAEYAWFGKAHYQAAKAGISFAEYQGLTEEQAGYLVRPFSLNRSQVEDLEAEQLRAVFMYKCWISNASQVRGLSGDALYAAIQSACDRSPLPLPEHATVFHGRMGQLRDLSDILANTK